jgi:PKD repeat protein
VSVGIARRDGTKWIPWLSKPGSGTTTPTVPPVSDFKTTAKNLVVTFDGSASRSVNGGIISYAWNFDDDRTGTGATTSHTYAAAGTYQPTLTVTDATGLTATTTRTVTVTAAVPTGDRANLVPGTYKPSSSTTGLLPGWSKSQLTKFTSTSGANSAGAYWTPASNTTYTNTWFNVRVLIGAAKNVVFKNCWFDGGTDIRGYQYGTGVIDCNSGQTAYTANTVVVQDSVLESLIPNNATDGIVGHGYTVRRCDIRGTVDGCGAYHVGGGPIGVLIEACYIHDLAVLSPSPGHSNDVTHNDGVQMQGGSGVTIRGNTISVNASPTASKLTTKPNPYPPSVPGQAISATPNTAKVTDVLIESNWLDYGWSTVTLIAGSQGGSNIGVIRNNKFGRNQPTIGGRKRPLVLTPASTVSGFPSTTGPDTQGNVYEDNGQPITIYREAA